MLLKKTIRFASYALAFLGIGSVQSCKDDDPSGDLCYRCTWEETDGDYTYEYQATYCFQDIKFNYNSDLTKDEFRDYIEEMEDNGYDCDKKTLV